MTYSKAGIHGFFMALATLMCRNGSRACFVHVTSKPVDVKRYGWGTRRLEVAG